MEHKISTRSSLLSPVVLLEDRNLGIRLAYFTCRHVKKLLGILEVTDAYLGWGLLNTPS